MIRLLAATALLVAATATSAHAATTVTTFNGNCNLRGTDAFTPPLTLTPQAGSAVADVSGTCTGTLTRAGGATSKLASAPARLVLRTTTSSISCGGGSLRGTATLQVGGATVSMKVDEPQVTAISALSISGSTTGSALGIAYASERTDIIGTVQGCVGPGVASVPIKLSFATLSPIG